MNSKWTRLQNIVYLYYLRRKKGEAAPPFVKPPTNPPFVTPVG